MAITYSTGSATATQNAIMAIVQNSNLASFNEECLLLVTEGWILQGSPFNDATNYVAQYYKFDKAEDSRVAPNSPPTDVRLV